MDKSTDKSGSSSRTRPRLIVCTFATPEYAGSAEVLRHTALDVGGADEVVVYGPQHVAGLYARSPDLLADSKGYGWFSWKPWCILQTLEWHAEDGDVVVYCDAGTTVLADLRPLADSVRHATLFRLGAWETHDYSNEMWTKERALELMGASARQRRAIQVNAGIQAYRKTSETAAFVDEYLRWCKQREVVDETGMERELEAKPGFQQHRHDQSVLSVLSAAEGTPVDVLRDPSQYGLEDPDLGEGAKGAQAEPPPAPWCVAGARRRALFDQHRRRLRPIKVGVVTPTVGGAHLEACVRSVQSQTLPNVHHYVVVDGPEHRSAVEKVLAEFRLRKPIHVVQLPHNVGKDGWNGHRVYGSLPWLLDADYVAFLDDDNQYDPDHLRDLVRAATSSPEGVVPWAYSLRRVVDQEGRDVCADNCESLGGLYHTACGVDDRLIDTSCYLIERDLAVQVSPAWNARFRDPDGAPEPDRQLARVLLSAAPHACVRKHSVRYRLGSTERSVGARFFLEGNEKFGYDFERYADLYVFHFSPESTARFLACRRARDRSYALDEWQMTLLKGLDGAGASRKADGNDEEDGGDEHSDEVELFNLLDGYACAPNLPPGAAVLVSLCQPDQVPWVFLKSRPDLLRVGYTLESPNIRHAGQWDPTRLAECFDVVLTYADFLLRDSRVNTAFCPHNTHHLDLDDPLDRAQLRDNADAGRSCAMVLERRDLGGHYSIPGTDVRLECLDPLRELLVRELSDVTVYGVGWDEAARRLPNIKLGHALHRSRDPRHAVDILQTHAFAVIAENCDVEWYASEKFYDALLAGAIPLYYGNVPPQLGVPEGPDEGVYLDLKTRFGNVPREELSARLQAFLDGLSDETVAAWKRRVVERREEILRRVGVASFAKDVRRALSNARKGKFTSGA